MPIEYKIQEVKKYVVTRDGEDGNSALGEYENAELAYAAGYALCKSEHETLGLPRGDMGIIYPERL